MILQTKLATVVEAISALLQSSYHLLRIFILTFCLGSSSLLANPKVSGPWDESDELEGLASSICAIYTMSGSKVAENAKRLIIDHMARFQKVSRPTQTQIIHFLNRNSQHMSCSDNKHYMKASFDHGRAYDQLFNVLFFDELLSDDENLWVDINGISLNEDGQPETVLDYMYIEVADKTNSDLKIREIQSLIDTFEEYLDGKRFHQLPAEVQQAWMDYAKEQR